MCAYGFYARLENARMLSSANTQATCRFLTAYDGLAMILGSSEALVSWYLIESSSSAIGSFAPGTLHARPLPGTEQRTLFWKAARTVVRRIPRRLALVAGGPDEVAGPPEDAEEEIDESRPEEDAPDEVFDLEADLVDMLEQAGELGEDGFPESGLDLVVAHGVPPAVAAGSSGADDGAVLVALEVPPPPAAAPEGRREEHGPRGAAAITVQVPGGSISYYASKSAFQAVCEASAHGRCVLTRTCRAKGSGPGARPKGGRPVGFLAAWLGHAEACAGKEQHWDPACFANSVETRADLRQRLARLESGRLLMSFERPRVPGEPEEPEDLAGLL